jgi:DNA-binding transcriptional LysR family regulator
VDKKTGLVFASRLESNSHEVSTAKQFANLGTMDPAWALYFSEVVEHSSLSRAAQALVVSTSTVSRKLDELESSIGVRLFDRDTRNLRLTEAGDTYLHYVRKALNALEEGRQVMARYNTEVRGQLRVWCPPALARFFVADIVLAFSAQHPQLEMTLKLESQSFSINNSDLDVGICIGMPLEERAVVSKLCSYSSGYVATPIFLQRYGVPQSIQDLSKLPMVKLAQENALQPETALNIPRNEHHNSTPKLMVNDTSIVLQAILSHQFIGKMMHWECQQHLANGSLERVLPGLDDEKTLYSLVPSRKGNPLKVQLFVDFLKTHLVPQFLRGEMQLDGFQQNR